MVTLKGCIEHIVYHSVETGYTVLSLSPAGEDAQTEDVITAVGTLPEVGEGEMLHLTGDWTSHPTYGQQFRFQSFQILPIEDAAAMERYLASGIIKGIKKALAARIVKKFGDQTFAILDREPERLAEIKGISKKKALEIAEQVSEKRDMRDALLFLSSHNIPNTLALRIWKACGSDLYSIIRENPYRLAEEVRGIGFRTADEIARKTGISIDSRHRIACALLFVLDQASREGSLYLPKEELCGRTAALLELPLNDPAYDPADDSAFDPAYDPASDLICDSLTSLSVEKKVILKAEDGMEKVYAARAYYAEMQAARLLAELNVETESDAEHVRRLVTEAAKRIGTEPEERQMEAVLEADRRGLMLLTGGPGTGKTTTLNLMISVFEEEGLEILLAAPTGRAAKRMQEATGREARTIHRLLEVSMDSEEETHFNHDSENPLEADVIIVDEMSMVDLYLFLSLLKAVIPGTHLIMVGDANQLPSVGPGCVLRDMIESGCITTVTLERIFRQAQKSDIVVNAHKINAGEYPVITNKSPDFFFIRENDPGTIIGTAVKLVRDNLPRYLKVDSSEIQVMVPMKKGVLGVANLNSVMQQYLNPESSDKEEYARGDLIFREGDRVMQIRNNYQIEWNVRGRHGAVIETGQGVFNGDMGIVRTINRFRETMTVEFDERHFVEYEFKELEQLEPAYAVTIHKSQGSEYPAVILPLLRGPRMLMNRNLLYTAVTRARRMVVIIGDPVVMNEMIDNTREAMRYTGLCLRIREAERDRDPFAAWGM